MSKVLGAEFAPEDIALVRKVASARGENVSSFLRRSVKTELARLSYLSVDEQRALGIEGRL